MRHEDEQDARQEELNGADPRRLLGLAEALAGRRGRSLTGVPLRLAALAGTSGPGSIDDDIGDDAGDPDVLGLAYEAALGADVRRARGAFFTPRTLADALVAEALDELPGAPTLCDPAAGGGAFLLAAARALGGRGVPRATVVRELLFGIDIDPLAIAVTEAALVLWALEDGDAASPGDHLAVGDALTMGWTGFDAVVGNPPFLSQLGTGTARSHADRAALRARFGAAAGGYADAASLFLVAACSMVRTGGRVALVQPESLLSARDAAPARDAVLRAGRLRSLWCAGEAVFAAGVRVCAPVVEVGAATAPDGAVRRFGGADFHLEEPVAGDLQRWSTWAPLLARSAGIPEIELGGHGTLGDRWTATADFRDQYYGLVPFVSDNGDGPPLITSGLIDPARSRWGETPTRFAKRVWQAPRVDLARLRATAPPAMRRWADARLVPKVLVATQTRVIEAVVDGAGAWLPCTPVITVTGPRLWHAAAVLSAPPVSAWALRTYNGAALSSGAIKLSASQVLGAPLPGDHGSWDAAVRRLRDGAPIEEVGAAMCAAYGAGADVYDWWRSRLPSRSSTRRTFASS